MEPGIIVEPPSKSHFLACQGLALLDHAPLPMAMTAGATQIVRYANLAFGRMVNLPVEQLLGSAFCDLRPNAHACAALINSVGETGKPCSHTDKDASGEHPVIRSYAMWAVTAQDQLMGVMVQVTESAFSYERTLEMNEALIHGALHQHALTEAADAHSAVLREEIQVRKRTEKALHLAQAQLLNRAGQLEGLVAARTADLVRINSQLEAFVYSIAHDLRAPLRHMQGFAMLLVEEAGAALNSKGQDYAARIDTSAKFMDALLIDLLQFSRTSQTQVALTPIALASVVTAVLYQLRPDIVAKHARVDNIGPWPQVMAHEATLVQALTNLTSNALKFASPGVLPIVRLRTEEDARQVRIWVEDNGIGITAAHHEEIFRLFTRLEGARYAGTGAGLAIVKKGVERMGGRVGVESAPGQGSRFWIELQKA